MKHPLSRTLIRQIKKAGLSEQDDPRLEAFFQLIHQSYEENAKARRLLEKSMEMMSDELVELNLKIKKDAEQKIHQVQKRSELALEATNDCLWDWEVGTNKLYVNPRWIETMGLSKEQLTGTANDWKDRLHPQDKERVLSAVNNHLQGKLKHYQAEYRICKPNGEIIWILDRGKIVEWTPEGHPVRMIGTNIDITHTKRTEKELRVALSLIHI